MSNIIKSEEFEKWRQTSEMNKNNHGEENSPILRLHQQHQEDIISSISDKKMSTLKGASSFYITLAKESPQRLYEESDESTYDSYHCRETDICRDSTDLDDSSSDFGSSASSTQSFHAVMEVVEYDVASNISGNEALYSNDSSSGTDDFFLTAIATKRIRQLSKSYNNSDFADTEDSVSDKSYDPELSLADYWKCVKCKNKQNNPMFRYCEKCYQIRKSHFPPRPRRSNLKRKQNSPLHNTNNYGGTIITQSPTTPAAAAPATTTDLSVSGQCQSNVSSKLEANENGEQQKIEERLNSNDDNDRIGNDSNGSKGCKKFRLNNSKLQTDNNSIGRNMYKLKKRKLFNNSKNNKSSEEMNSNSSSSSSNSGISDTNSIFDESSTEISEFEIEYSISSRGNRKRKISPKTKENVNSNNNKCYKGINKIKCSNSGSSSSSSSGKMKNKIDNIKNKNLSNNISLNDDKHVNNTENKVFKSAIKLNSDSENNDAIVSSSPCRRNITMLISQKDSGISSAPPSSQEMPSSSSSHSDDPHILSNNRYSEEDDDDSDTVVEELDDKELKEIREKYTNSPINQNENENISMKFLDNSGNSSSITSCDKTIKFSSITSSLSSSEINVNCNTDKNVTKNNSEITFRDFSGIMNNDEENNKNNNKSSSSSSVVTPTKRNISNFNNSPSSRNNNNNNNNSTGTNDNTNSIENGQCVVCLSEPKNGAFIHTKSAHLCCCYKCAVKIWNTRKKCPVCNCSVKNVLKLFVH